MSAHWRVVPTADGSPTLAHPRHGETCHSDAGAWTEARERYAAPCRLGRRARGGADRVLRLLDVGTGLGLNLAAALEAVESADTGVALDVVTLEHPDGPLESVLAHFGDGSRPPGAAADGAPADLERWWAPVRRALAMALEADRFLAGPGIPLGQRSRLRLFVGDAARTLPAAPPALSFDAVFLDPFSPRTEPALWSPTFLAALAERMAPASWLSTYSASLAIRAALSAAGLRVGPGPRVGAKSAGTIASPDLDPGTFDARTARRLERRAAELREAAP